MNPISEKIKIGTIGELLVQLRLLQYEVQAAPALKDSGNDLIAVKGSSFRAIQVKTTIKNRISLPNLHEYHILAIVKLEGENDSVYLDKSKIYLLEKSEVNKSSYSIRELSDKEINRERVEGMFK